MHDALRALAAWGTFSVEGEWVYGATKGIPFRASEMGGCFHFEWKVDRSKRAARSLQKQGAIWKKSAPHVYISLTFAQKASCLVADLRLARAGQATADIQRFFVGCADWLETSDMAGACFACGKARESLTFYRLDDTPAALCVSCAEKTRQAYASGAAQSGSRAIRGAIGAFAGGIIATIPWILLSHFGYIAAACGFLIAYGAQKGYHLMGGRRGKAEGAILIFVSLFCVLFACYESLLFEVAWIFRSEGYLLNAYEVNAIVSSALIDTPGDMIDVWYGVILGLIFAAVGVWRLLSESQKKSPAPVSIEVLPETSGLPLT